MNKILLTSMLIATLFVAGCWDDNQAARMLYINGLGIDFKDGKYEVYAQIIDFANTAKSEQPTSDQPQAEVGFASGATVNDAMKQLYHSIDQRVFWGNLSYIVFSEDAMKNVKLSPVVDIFIRFRETRYQILLYATEDSVEEILLVKPVINKAVTLSKLGDPTNSFAQESFISPVDFRKLIIELDEPGNEAVIPFITLDDNWKSINEKIKAPVLTGVSIITRDDYKGRISGNAVLGIQWMTNKTKRAQIYFSTDNGSKAEATVENVKVKITPDVTNGVKFNVEVLIEATLSGIDGKVTAKKIKRGLEKEIRDQIMTTYHDAIEKDIDIYRFTEQLYRKELKVWKQHQVDGKVQLTDDSLDKLTVQVTRLTSNRKAYKETIKK